jgi:hypothetical protein
MRYSFNKRRVCGGTDLSERLTSTYLDFDVGFTTQQHFDDFEVTVLTGRLKGSA